MATHEAVYIYMTLCSKAIHHNVKTVNCGVCNWSSACAEYAYYACTHKFLTMHNCMYVLSKCGYYQSESYYILPLLHTTVLLGCLLITFGNRSVQLVP